MTALASTRTAFLTSQTGAKRAVFTSPWQAVIGAGGTPTRIAPEARLVQSMVDDVEKDEIFEASVSATTVTHQS